MIAFNDRMAVINLLLRGSIRASMGQNNDGDTVLHIAFRLKPAIDASNENYLSMVRKIFKINPEEFILNDKNKMNETVLDVILQTMRDMNKPITWKLYLMKDIINIFTTNSMTTEKIKVFVEVMKKIYEIFENEFLQIYNSKMNTIVPTFYEAQIKVIINNFYNFYEHVEMLSTASIYTFQNEIAGKFIALFTKLDMLRYVPYKYAPPLEQVKYLAAPDQHKVPIGFSDGFGMVSDAINGHLSLDSDEEMDFLGFGYQAPLHPDIPYGESRLMTRKFI